MAKEKKEAEKAGEAGVETKELVKVSGVGQDVLDGIGGSMLPAFNPSMTLEQRRDTARQILTKTTRINASISIITGEALYETFENEYWKEWTFDAGGEEGIRNFASFAEYAEEELGMSKREADYHKNIYKKCILEIGLPIDAVRDFAWTKLASMYTILTKDNWMDVFEQVKDLSVSETKRFAAEYIAKRDGKEVPSSTGTRAESDPDADGKGGKITVNFAPEQLNNFNLAMDIAKSHSGSASLANNIDLIATDFVSMNAGSGLDGKLNKLDILIGNISRAYGVELVVKSTDSTKLLAGDDKAAKSEEARSRGRAIAKEKVTAGK
jgi:hypothetical protein